MQKQQLYVLAMNVKVNPKQIHKDNLIAIFDGDVIGNTNHKPYQKTAEIIVKTTTYSVFELTYQKLMICTNNVGFYEPTQTRRFQLLFCLALLHSR
jgi:hypothetical protein